jgi:hypothetical protein
VEIKNIELRAEHQLEHYYLHRQYWEICNVCRRNPEPPEETYAVRESRSLYHMRNGFDRESNPRPQRWQAPMLISNIDLTTAPHWQPCPVEIILILRSFIPNYCVLYFKFIFLLMSNETEVQMMWWNVYGDPQLPKDWFLYIFHPVIFKSHIRLMLAL